MAHDVHDPVITTDTDGNYIHTSCRECGMQLDAPVEEPAALTEDEFYETPVEEPA